MIQPKSGENLNQDCMDKEIKARNILCISGHCLHCYNIKSTSQEILLNKIQARWLGLTDSLHKPQWISYTMLGLTWRYNGSKTCTDCNTNGRGKSEKSTT